MNKECKNKGKIITSLPPAMALMVQECDPLLKVA